MESKIPDPEGRYVILVGHLMDTLVTIVSYYAPNTNQIPFFTSLFTLLNTHAKGRLILCGDSNLTLLPSLDKSALVPQTIAEPTDGSSSQLRSLLSQHSLVDCWHELNPTTLDYTFYSHPHETFSHIDHVFLPLSQLLTVLECDILPISWSDHDVVLTTFSSLLLKRLGDSLVSNDSLLSDLTIASSRETSLEAYFTLNEIPTDSQATLWNAHKAVLRGKFIQLTIQRKKTRQALQRNIKAGWVH